MGQYVLNYHTSHGCSLDSRYLRIISSWIICKTEEIIPPYKHWNPLISVVFQFVSHRTSYVSLASTLLKIAAVGVISFKWESIALISLHIRPNRPFSWAYTLTPRHFSKLNGLLSVTNKVRARYVVIEHRRCYSKTPPQHHSREVKISYEIWESQARCFTWHPFLILTAGCLADPSYE